MADGSFYDFTQLDFQTTKVSVAGRRVRCRATAAILHFVTAYGAAPATFIADYYNLDRHQTYARCCELVRQKTLIRWFFDGQALYALPKDAPCDEVLNAPPAKRQRRPRTKKNLEGWALTSHAAPPLGRAKE